MYRDAFKLDLAGKALLLRLDLNVPVKDGQVQDVTRILAALPTIEKAMRSGARVFICSHLGRPSANPSNDDKKRFSLKPVAEELAKRLDCRVEFIEDVNEGGIVRRQVEAKNGDVFLIENTRFLTGETENDAKCATLLAQGFDVYMNDAFGTLHRAHASTVGVVKHVPLSGLGLLVFKELNALTPLLEHPESPYVMILGGAKVKDKIGVIENFLNKVNTFLIGGGMAFTFLKAQGVEVGTSLVDENFVGRVQSLLEKAANHNVQVLLPSDFRIDRDGKAVNVDSLQTTEAALDVGDSTAKAFASAIEGAKTIFWNGPLGVFEREGFDRGTLEVAQAVAASSANTVIGGGDTLAAFTQLKLQDKVSFASTGGGATLEFLEGNELPGLAAMKVS